MIQRDWEGEWTEIVLQKQQAIERSQQYQAEVISSLRRRRPPPMQLLRDADRAAADLARIKAREESFLREWRSAHGMQSA